MTIRSTTNLAIVTACVLMLSACGSKAPTANDRAGHTAIGDILVTGAFDFASHQLGRGTRIAQEPYQETFALRLAFDQGNDLYRGLLVDIDDLPAEVAGNYVFGDGIDADLNFRAADPNDSGRRFSIREGQLEVHVSNGRASGTIRGMAKETSFTGSEASLEITIEFDEVLIQEPGS